MDKLTSKSSRKRSSMSKLPKDVLASYLYKDEEVPTCSEDNSGNTSTRRESVEVNPDSSCTSCQKNQKPQSPSKKISSASSKSSVGKDKVVNYSKIKSASLPKNLGQCLHSDVRDIPFRDRSASPPQSRTRSTSVTDSSMCYMSSPIDRSTPVLSQRDVFPGRGRVLSASRHDIMPKSTMKKDKPRSPLCNDITTTPVKKKKVPTATLR